jgi:hypothetical protein
MLVTLARVHREAAQVVVVVVVVVLSLRGRQHNKLNMRSRRVVHTPNAGVWMVVMQCQAQRLLLHHSRTRCSKVESRHKCPTAWAMVATAAVHTTA